TLQHPVGPQDQALAEATCTARQANEHQKNGFAILNGKWGNVVSAWHDLSRTNT
ncbi:MAG: hypothetical protein, partial [Olavius algarvensis Gamma 1 endosymbiont]